jgi:hypothetical protein
LKETVEGWGRVGSEVRWGCFDGVAASSVGRREQLAEAGLVGAGRDRRLELGCCSKIQK